MAEYHNQERLEALIDEAAARLNDGVVETPEPVSADVVERAKRWLSWMIEVAFSTSHRWVEPGEIVRTNENEIAFIWEKGDRHLYVTVGLAADFFWYEGHAMWGPGKDGDASDPASMRDCWSLHWRA